jgi:curved DNA-binding protein CbpA
MTAQWSSGRYQILNAHSENAARFGLNDVTIQGVIDDVAAIVEVTLVGTRPLVRRLISIPYSVPLSRFHSVLQLVMGWEEKEGHVFVAGGLIAGARSEITSGDAEDESRVTLDELIPFVGAEAFYFYDFAKEWRHRLRLLDLGSATDEIRLLKGSGRSPGEGAAPGAKIGKPGKSSAADRNKAKTESSFSDVAAINQELSRLSNRWKRRRRLAPKNSRSELILMDTSSIRAGYLRDLQSVRNSILAVEDDLTRHESQDLPEFRRFVNIEFGAHFSTLRELHQEIDWLAARLALVQKLMLHGTRPVERAYLQALQIESGELPYPDFRTEPEEIPIEPPQPKTRLDRDTIRNFISATGQEFLSEDEVESLTEEVLQEAGQRDLLAECKKLYRKIVSLLHPDRAGEMTPDRKDLWLRAQAAYADGDVLSLRSVLDRCGAGMPDQYLTCSEIIDAIAQATMQLQAIEMFRERTAKEPSWDFCQVSEKRKRGRLRRVTRDLDAEESTLRIQLVELQRECRRLEEQARRWESQQTGETVQMDLFR